MCGFFQVAQRNKPINRELFEAALRSMSHRGPDQSGTFFHAHQLNAQTTIHHAFGHQRLSIIDLSEQSRQPFLNDAGVLLFNGEIYNYQELKTPLLTAGELFVSSGDTEVVSKMMAKNPKSCFSEFNGMWAISWLNKEDGTITLSRDRYGKKPLFYYMDAETLCISSTIKAIQIFLQASLHFNKNRLLNYLVFDEQYPSATATTHFDNINQVLPGHRAIFDPLAWQLAQHSYFEFHDPFQTNKHDLSEESLIETLKDSVRKRLISDRPVALLLSGGIDSSLILSTLVALDIQDQCHIYMGDTGRSADHHYAKLCTEATGIKATSVKLDYDSNTFDRFMQVCRHQEKPVSLNGSSMGMPQMYETIASHGIPVVLDGTGGDELFGGYWQRQFPFAVRQARQEKNWAWLLKQAGENSSDNNMRKFILSSYIPHGISLKKHTIGKQLKALINPFITAEFTEIMKSSPTDPMEKRTASFSEAMCRDIAPGGRLAEWLWHNDRNSMMFSVEGRSPLLDHRLNKFIYTRYDQKFSGQWNKMELRKAFDKLTPLPTQWREQKQGFRWDGKHFLNHNQDKIIALIESNRCLNELGLVNTQKLATVLHKQPKLLKSSFAKQVLTISAVEQAFLRPD